MAKIRQSDPLRNLVGLSMLTDLSNAIETVRTGEGSIPEDH